MKLILGLLINMILSIVGVGIWLMAGKVLTAGDYTLDFWATVQFVFILCLVFDALKWLWNKGNKIEHYF
jgi:hypothetical protein